MEKLYNWMKGNSLDFVTEEGLKDIFTGDVSRLQQFLNNLLLPVCQKRLNECDQDSDGIRKYLSIEKSMQILEELYGIPVLLLASDFQSTDFEEKPHSILLAIITYLVLIKQSLGDQKLAALLSADNASEHKKQETDISTSQIDSPNQETSPAILLFCGKCQKPLESILDRIVMSSAEVFHRKCFQCSLCSKLLHRGAYRAIASTLGQNSPHFYTYECLAHRTNDILDAGKNSEIPKRDSDKETTGETINSEKIDDENGLKPEADQRLELSFDIDDQIREEELEQIDLTADLQTSNLPKNELDIDVKMDKLSVSIPTISVQTDLHQSRPDTIPDKIEVTNESKKTTTTVDTDKIEVTNESKKATTTVETAELLPVPPPRKKRQKVKKIRENIDDRSYSGTGENRCDFDKGANSNRPIDICDYPDFLNPFGSDDEHDSDASSYDDSLNPFHAEGDEVSIEEISTSNETSLDRKRHQPNSLDRQKLGGNYRREQMSKRGESQSPAAIYRLSLNPDDSKIHSKNSARNSSDENRSNRRLSAPPSQSPNRRNKRRAPDPPKFPPVSGGPDPLARPPQRPPAPCRAKLNTDNDNRKPRRKARAPPPPMPLKRKIAFTDHEICESRAEVERALDTLNDGQSLLEERANVLQMEMIRHISPSILDWQKSSKSLDVWISLVSEKCAFMRQEAALVCNWLELYLNDIHSETEYQLRCLIEKPESDKTEVDIWREAKLLELLLDIIGQKNRLIELSDKEDAHLAVGKNAVQSKSCDIDRHSQEKAKTKKLKIRMKKLKKKLGRKDKSVK